MNGTLVYDSLDPNDRAVVEGILRATVLELATPANWHDPEVDATYYFRTPSSTVPSGPGWYVIVDADHSPLYVGASENLDARLNSRDGSRDQFANPKRTSDSARNFLKRFVSTGILDELRVGVVKELAVLHQLNRSVSLSKVDRCNVEKILGICRVGILTAPVRA